MTRAGMCGCVCLWVRSFFFGLEITPKWRFFSHSLNWQVYSMCVLSFFSLLALTVRYPNKILLGLNHHILFHWRPSIFHPRMLRQTTLRRLPAKPNAKIICICLATNTEPLRTLWWVMPWTSSCVILVLHTSESDGREFDFSWRLTQIFFVPCLWKDE